MYAKEYQIRAARTLVDAPDFELTPAELMLSWNVLGLVGEAAEIAELVATRPLDVAKLQKEVGDCFWYCAAIATKERWDLHTVITQGAILAPRTHPGDLGWYILGLVASAGHIAELVKKGVYHRHGLDRVDLHDTLGLCTWYLGGIVDVMEWDLGELLDANIIKLEKRYPRGYTHQASIDRIDTHAHPIQNMAE